MATNERTLAVEAFMQEVTQRGLDVKGPSGGYLYAGYQGVNGWEVIRTPNNPWYYWSFRQVCTQDGGAGGHLVAIVTVPTDGTFILKGARLEASGNRALLGQVVDSNSAVIGRTMVVSAVAGANVCIPSIGTASTGSANTMGTFDLTIANGMQLTFQVTSAAQTETATVAIHGVIDIPTRPTVSWATSGGTPNAAAATVNTLTLVPMP